MRHLQSASGEQGEEEKTKKARTARVGGYIYSHTFLDAIRA